MRGGANSFAHTYTHTHSDAIGATIAYANGDTDTERNTIGNAYAVGDDDTYRHSQSDTAATADSAPSPDALTRSWNSFVWELASLFREFPR